MRRTELGLPHGSIKCTVLIETILAAFEMDAILYELRDHSCALNAGRWDYIFSCIKKLGAVLPDRAQVTMTVPFMRAYSELLVKTCHQREAHAIGGMAAFIPSRRDAEVNAVALAKVSEDKRREATAGFDGTWVAHPDLVPVALGEFDAVLGERANQVERKRDDVEVSEQQLVDFEIPGGQITDDGLRVNVSVGVRYLDAWLQGVGAAAIDNLMEDAATAEISRAQVWSWVQAGRFDDSTSPAGDRRRRGLRRRQTGLRRRRAHRPAAGLPHQLGVRFAGMTLESTKADDIAVVIEEAIVSGELAPGSVLRQEQLSERFGVSRTPVREALRRLAALGLVSFEPNKGVRVRTLSRDDLREAFLVRAELEALVTEIAARKWTPEAMVELEDCEKRFARLTKEIRSHEPGGERRSLMADWMHANHAFHDVIYRVAEVPFIESVAKSARRTFSGPTVWAPVDEELERLYERNQAEHRAIRQALAAGSVAGARVLAHEHVMHSFRLLTTILDHVGADWARN